MEFYPAAARCHQRALPIVDAVGRVITSGACVRERGGSLAGEVIHLFDFADTHSPEIEVCAQGVIFVVESRLSGGCWRFDTLLVS